MRNILQYPMTYEEAIGILDELSNSLLDKGTIGDIRPYALQWVKDKLLALKEYEDSL